MPWWLSTIVIVKEVIEHYDLTNVFFRKGDIFCECWWQILKILIIIDTDFQEVAWW